MTTPNRPTRKAVFAATRRGAALAAVITLLAIVNIALIAAARSSSDQADAATLRIESERAFYAAESGVMLLIGRLGSGDEPPEAGETVTFGGQRIEYAVVPESETGTFEILGQSGRGYRRVLIEIE